MSLAKNFLPFLLIFLIGVSCIINVVTVKDGHNWGDDFAQYILHANNIAEGAGYNDGIMLENPVIYPPGFPALLTPLVVVFGNELLLLKLPNIFYWYLGILLFYPIFRENLGKNNALLACAFLGVSYFFFIFKQNILSDVPFFCLCCATFAAFAKYEASQNTSTKKITNGFFGLLVLLLACSFLIRSAAFILYAASIFYFLIIKRNWRAFLWIAVSFAAVFSFQTMIIGIHPAFFMDIKNEPLTALSMIIKNFSLTFHTILWLFIPDQAASSKGFYQFVAGLLNYGAFVIFFILSILFLKKLLSRTLTFFECFAFFYLIVLIIWARDIHPPSGFARFVLPVLPLIVLFTIKAVKNLCLFIKLKFNRPINHQICAGIFLSVFIFFNILNIAAKYHFDDDVFNREENKQLFQWVREHVDRDEHYMIWQARAMALMTDRVGAPFWMEGFQEAPTLWERVERLNIAYIILNKGFDDPFINQLNSQPQLATFVWENVRYKIYKVQGAWKNGVNSPEIVGIK